MADEVHELAVAIRAEGTQETQDELDDTRQSFGETADDVGESTELLSGFADKFTGAGLIFAGAFGTMVAAIASKMPIIKELSAGLDAVLTAIGLRMDRLTRDRLQPLNRGLFDLSELIVKTDDAFTPLVFSIGLFNDAIESLSLPAAAEAAIPFINKMRTVETVLTGILLFMETKKPFQTIADGARNALSGLGDFITALGDRIISAVVSNVVNPFIVQLNRLIRKVNKIKGIDISEVSPIAAGPTAGAGGRRSFREADPATGGNGNALTPGGQVVVTGTLDSETNLDSETVATETKPFTVKGVLGSGRGARLR